MPVTRFVSQFLLPLVKGGMVHVGRPISRRALERIEASRLPRARGHGLVVTVDDIAEREALEELAHQRHARARSLLPSTTPPTLDETTLRLGAAVHNLLAMGHPGLGNRMLDRRRERIAMVTLTMADIGPPCSPEEATNRHSLLARLPEITRTEHTVDYWAGQRHYVGRPPPARLLSMPNLRRVVSTSVRRLWLREIGIPPCARPVWLALHRASPLGEALDPMRLDPPLGWGRVIPVLRFPSLCRIVAGKLVDLGLDAAGSALIGALLRFASVRETAGARATPASVGFVIRFLAHAAWLDHMFGVRETPRTLTDLGLLLATADEIDHRLVWPPDVSRTSDLGRSFLAELTRIRAEARAPADRHAALAAVCWFAAGAIVPGGS